MSYVIHVWEHPVPATLEEADGILGELLDETSPGKQPRLAALVNALWERYPRDLDTDREDPVWSDGSLAKGYDGLPVVTLGIMTPHLDEVVPFVAQTANSLGLVVFDLQYGTAYLPSGRVLGAKPAAPSPTKEKPLNRVKVQDALALALKPFLGTQGFKSRRVSDYIEFVGAFDGGEHTIALLTFDDYPNISVDFIVKTHLEKIDEVVNTVIHPGSKRPHTAVTCSFGQLLRDIDAALASTLLKDGGKRLLVCSMDDIPSMADAVISFFCDRMFPHIRQCETAQGVWRNSLAYPKGEKPRLLLGSVYGDVIAGRLAGDPRFEDRAQAELSGMSADLQKFRATLV